MKGRLGVKSWGGFKGQKRCQDACLLTVLMWPRQEQQEEYLLVQTGEQEKGTNTHHRHLTDSPTSRQKPKENSTYLYIRTNSI